MDQDVLKCLKKLVVRPTIMRTLLKLKTMLIRLVLKTGSKKPRKCKSLNLSQVTLTIFLT